MIPFHQLTPAEQEMAVYHHAKLYVAAINRGSVAFHGNKPVDAFKAIMAIARADAEDTTYTAAERRTILSPRSTANA